jgi:hypothetical protein
MTRASSVNAAATQRGGRVSMPSSWRQRRTLGQIRQRALLQLDAFACGPLISNADRLGMDLLARQARELRT